MSATREPASAVVTAYVSAVRDELSQLPADELAEITEDVRDHLDQVAAELGDDVSMDALIGRLGTPAAYAAELRSAAGLAEPEPTSPPAHTGFFRRLLRGMVTFAVLAAVAFVVVGVFDMLFVSYGSVALFMVAAVWVVAAAGGVFLLLLGRDNPAEELKALPGARLVGEARRWLTAKPWGPPAIDFVTSLRPAWWLVRAAALGLIVAHVVTVPLGGVVFLAALVASVWLGLRTRAGGVDGAGLLAVNAANVALAVGGVLAAGSVLNNVVPGYVEYVEYHPEDEPGIYSESGEVDNIFVYGPDGKLLTNVRIYDGDGRPIDLPLVDTCYDGALPGDEFTALNPWGDNVFPRGTVRVDELGECGQPEVKPPFGATLPGSDAFDPTPDATPGSEQTPAATHAPGSTATPSPPGDPAASAPPSASTPGKGG